MRSAILLVAALAGTAAASGPRGWTPSVGASVEPACADRESGCVCHSGVLPGIACYDPDMSPQDLDRLVRQFGLRPPTAFPPDGRYFNDISAWTGDVALGPANQAQKARLTISFANDGISWGLGPVGILGISNLNSRLVTAFGATGTDRGRELIRQALASWRRQNGITYHEVRDDGTVEDQSLARSANHGDVRIAGFNMGGSGILAYNAFPDPSGLAAVGGSDMNINTFYFDNGTFGNSASNYRYLRNVVSHEHGHGLGFIHPVPCAGTKLMEPFINTGFDGTQIDEYRAGGANYGDRYSGNNSAANAKDFGSLTSPSVKSIVERNLSSNGAGAPLGTGEDWFKFTLGSTQTVSIAVEPVGGVYDNGEQFDQCNGSITSVNAQAAGNLNVELRDAAGTTVLASASGAGAGAAEIIAAASRGAGTYTVRVVDVGPNPSNDQRVQLYDLTIRVGTSKALPQAVAGVNKRIAVNQTCYFMGNINSRAMETGATLSTYAWDLDGNGTFEVANNGQPTKTYTTAGTVNVTLRVTDSNSMQATDTIQVEVYDPAAPWTVGGGSCPWLSAQPGGVTNSVGDAAPAQSPVQVFDQAMTVTDELRFTVTGSVKTSAAGSLVGADGDSASVVCFPAAGENGMAGACAPRGALMGVFVSGFSQSVGPVSGLPALDFSTPASRDYAVIGPALNQPFFIGDGRTSGGATQRVVIPNGGNRLFLCVMDNTAWGDNAGSFSVSVAESIGTPGAFDLLSPADGATVTSITPLLDWAEALGASSYTVTCDNNSDFSSPYFSQSTSSSQVSVAAGTLPIGGPYYWKVVASNPGGRTTNSTPTVQSFYIAAPPPPCPADLNNDHLINTGDLTVLLANFGGVVPPGTQGDLSGDGVVNTIDLSQMLGVFGTACP